MLIPERTTRGDARSFRGRSDGEHGQTCRTDVATPSSLRSASAGPKKKSVGVPMNRPTVTVGQGSRDRWVVSKQTVERPPCQCWANQLFAQREKAWRKS